MPDIKEYYVRIFQAAKGLDPDAAALDEADSDPHHTHLKRASKVIWVTSVENYEKQSAAGQSCEMTAWHAAERIVNGTHRLATPQEIEAEITRRAAEHERIVAEEAERKGHNLPPQMQHLVGALMANAAASLEQRAPRNKQQ